MSRAGPAGRCAIVQAGPDDIAAIRALFVEYGESLDFSLCFQDFDRELAGLPGDYAPPAGRLLLARVDGAPAGTVAVRPLQPGICEMKRLYLRPAHRGHGLGRRLAVRAIDEARAAGYRAMRLDTVGATMAVAVALYKELGFVEIPPYTDAAPVALTCYELSLRRA